MESSILQFGKITCKQHPFQVVTNFCVNQQCMTELCASCICTHTEMHVRNSTSPLYQPLREVHHSLHKKVNDQMKLLDADKQRLAVLSEKISNRKRQFKSTLQAAKQDVLNMVEKHFTLLEQKFEADVKLEQKSTGLHSLYQLDTLSKRVSKQMSNLLQDAHQINSMYLLEIIGKLNKQTLSAYENFHSQTVREIEQNQSFSASLSYKKEHLEEIGGVIKKLFSLNFSYPKITDESARKSWMRQNSSSHLSVANSNRQIVTKRYSTNFTSSQANINPSFVQSNSANQNIQPIYSFQPIYPTQTIQPTYSSQPTYPSQPTCPSQQIYPPQAIHAMQPSYLAYPLQACQPSQPFQTSSLYSSNASSRIQFIPKYIDMNNMSKLLGKEQKKTRKATGLQIVSNQQLNSEHSKQNNSVVYQK